MILFFLTCLISISVFHVYGRVSVKLLLKAIQEKDVEVPFSIVQILGMTVLSTFINIYSLFGPINHSVVFFIATFAFVALYYTKNSCIADLRKIKKYIVECRSTVRVFFLILVAFIITVGIYPPINGDTGVYHAQAIRWLQELGTVIGLGNLQVQFSQNHSWFFLQSIFTYSFINNTPMHTLSGVIFFLLGTYLITGINDIINRKYSFSSIFRACVLPLFILFNSENIASLSPDLAVTVLILLSFTYFIEQIESGNPSTFVFSILAILTAYAITIKLSAIPLLLLPMYVLFLKREALLRQERISLLVITAVCSIITVPWLISNVLLSGYLVFPFHYIDLFNVNWKLDAQTLESYFAFIPVFNRNPEFLPFGGSKWFSWLSVWLKQQTIQDKLLFVFTIGSLMNTVLIIVINFFVNKKLLSEKYNLYCVASLLASVCITFWFVNAPALRFGYGYLVTLVSIQVTFWIYSIIRNHKIIIPFFLIISMILSIFLSLAFMEFRYFLIPRELLKDDFIALQRSMSTYDDRILDEFYVLNKDTDEYELRLFLPFRDKLRIVKYFLLNGYGGGDGLNELGQRVIAPAIYPIVPTYTEKLGTVVFHRKAIDEKNKGGWYNPFPYAIGSLSNIELRGKDLEGGFRGKSDSSDKPN